MKVGNCKKIYLQKLGFNSLEECLRDNKYLYIGRDMSYFVKGAKGSKWQNPFSVKQYGREECLNKYRKYILDNVELMNSLHELKGKTLMCWCHPDSCHGDILMELVKKIDLNI